MSEPEDVRAWREELLRVGVIVQDDDDTVPDDEREARFDRYVEMLDGLDGSESAPVLEAVVETYTDQEDYGAYQTLFGTLRRFPGERVGRALARAAPRLVDAVPERVGDLLMETRWGGTDGFNAEAAKLPPDQLAALRAFVRAEEEPDGYLEEMAGELVPEP